MLVEAEDPKHQEGVTTDQDEHEPLPEELMNQEASCSQQLEKEANETMEEEMSYASQGGDDEESEEEIHDKSQELELYHEKDRMTIYNYMHETEAPKAIEKLVSNEDSELPVDDDQTQ